MPREWSQERAAPGLRRPSAMMLHARGLPPRVSPTATKRTTPARQSEREHQRTLHPQRAQPPETARGCALHSALAASRHAQWCVAERPIHPNGWPWRETEREETEPASAQMPSLPWRLLQQRRQGRVAPLCQASQARKLAADGSLARATTHEPDSSASGAGPLLRARARAGWKGRESATQQIHS